MSIHYGVRIWNEEDELLTAAVSDHCFGGLRYFPDISYDAEGSSSSNAVGENLTEGDASERLHEVVLFLDEGFQDGAWSNRTEFLLEMKLLVADIPWMSNIKIRVGSQEIAYIIDDTTRWDQLILGMTFFRNIMCYNSGYSYKKFRDEGLSRHHSSMLSQFILLTSSVTGSAYVENDEEYSWMCPSSMGSRGFQQLISAEGPPSHAYNQKAVKGGGEGGYMRDEDYEADDEVFNENADSDWGEESNYYMMLCRTYCFTGDTPLPFMNGSANRVGELSLNVDNWKISNIATGFRNWLTTI
jgi:hypothetical protein